MISEMNNAVPALHLYARNERIGSWQDSVCRAPCRCHRKSFGKLTEEGLTSEKHTPGRSTPLDLITTEDHDRTSESRRLKCSQRTPRSGKASRPTSRRGFGVLSDPARWSRQWRRMFFHGTSRTIGGFWAKRCTIGLSIALQSHDKTAHHIPSPKIPSGRFRMLVVTIHAGLHKRKALN
jgi:hypothetical protein